MRFHLFFGICSDVQVLEHQDDQEYNNRMRSKSKSRPKKLRKAVRYGHVSKAIIENAKSQYTSKKSSSSYARLMGEQATFAAGNFWYAELVFQRIPGVVSTQVGYTGGHTPNPLFRDVCSGQTGHAEAVQIRFLPSVISYEDILEILFDTIQMDKLILEDPNSQYRPIIFYHTEEQQAQAQLFLQKNAWKFAVPVNPEVSPAQIFYEAEPYHQQYLEKEGQSGGKGEFAAIYWN